MARIAPFNRLWEFVLSVPSIKLLPAAGPVEIAFAGRSNVGKSSLINALTGVKGLAKTSNTPGRTQQLNYFVPSSLDKKSADLPPLALVDMPGYGYAKAPKSEVEKWTKLVFDYLRGRTTLKRVYVLIDARHGIKNNDRDVLKILDTAAVSYQLIITKADKIKGVELEDLKIKTTEKIMKHPAAFPEIIVTSSEKGLGLDDLRRAIVNLSQ